MNETSEVQIFFIIASVGTVFFIILLSVVLYHLIKVVRLVQRIVERIEAGSETVATDIATVRAAFAGGGIVGKALGFMSGVRNRRTHNDENEE